MFAKVRTTETEVRQLGAGRTICCLPLCTHTKLELESRVSCKAAQTEKAMLFSNLRTGKTINSEIGTRQKGHTTVTHHHHHHQNPAYSKRVEINYASQLQNSNTTQPKSTVVVKTSRDHHHHQQQHHRHDSTTKTRPTTTWNLACTPRTNAHKRARA